MGMIKFLVGLLFVSIFAIAIVSYAVGFGSDNSAEVSLVEDSDLNVLSSNTQSDVEDFKLSAEESEEIFDESSIAPGDDNIEGGGMFKLGPKDAVSATKTIVTSSGKKIFGEGSEFSFIINTIFAFLALLVVYYGWKLWKGGSPD